MQVIHLERSTTTLTRSRHGGNSTMRSMIKTPDKFRLSCFVLQCTIFICIAQSNSYCSPIVEQQMQRKVSFAPISSDINLSADGSGVGVGGGGGGGSVRVGASSKLTTTTTAKSSSSNMGTSGSTSGNVKAERAITTTERKNRSHLRQQNCSSANVTDPSARDRIYHATKPDVLIDHSVSVEQPPAAESRRQGRRDDLSHLFREEIDNYPDEEIKAALRKTPKELRDLFNVLNTALDPNMSLTARVASHLGDDDAYDLSGEREESICRSVIRNIYPKEANRDDSLVYVPNNKEFMQVIQAEICQSPNDECNYLKDNLPYGMTSVCYQKYAYKKLLYLDPLEKRMASDLFRYPSCCSCYVRTSSVDLRSSNPKSTLRLNQDPQYVSGTKLTNNPDVVIVDQSESHVDPQVSDSFTPNAQRTNLTSQPETSLSFAGSDKLSTLVISTPSVKVLGANGEASRQIKRMSADQVNTRKTVIPSASSQRVAVMNSTSTVVLDADKVYKPSRK